MEGQYVRGDGGLGRRRIVMMKILYALFAGGVLMMYSTAAWFGWELANSGSKSRLGVPFIYTGFRGGK